VVQIFYVYHNIILSFTNKKTPRNSSIESRADKVLFNLMVPDFLELMQSGDYHQMFALLFVVAEKKATARKVARLQMEVNEHVPSATQAIPKAHINAIRWIKIVKLKNKFSNR